MTPLQSPPATRPALSSYSETLSMTVKITSAAAVNALAVLRSINKEASQTQQQVSSGYRIETAADDASYWSVATVMRSDSTNLGTIGDALGLGAAKVDATYTAMTSAIDLVTQIRAKLVAAREPGTDKDKINAEISEYKEQLRTVVESTSFAGENWLLNSDKAAPPTWSVISGFVRAPTGEYQAQSIDFPSSQTILIDKNNASGGLFTKAIDAQAINNSGTGPRNYYLLDADSTTPATGTEVAIGKNTTDAQLADMLDVTDSLLSSLTTTSASIGVMKARIDDQIDYTADLSDSIDKSVGALVDTDMDEASIRQKAIETQKQMAVEAISILNTAASKILILLE
ncbi:flagellin C 4 [Rhizobium etli bv. phaseoli str. IE4803]|uniref:Flagellin n=2 Tax=Rhizobium/Agrobacterium group TaxID=227290 RepID=A0A060HWC1_RHIET|nr:flagellin C 4 [Rhizobium sp. IE4771]AJC77948.1 flagellin C 4 [Rhizobium etli bv. phaseoli str. IE4803]ARQ56805.1 flagellin C 4 [Rhizobium sp. Kim5]